jgi:hypothetical protein
MSQRIPSGPVGLLVLLASSLQPTSAAPQQLFSSISGYWVGPGRIEFSEAASEALLCRAYYTTKNEDERLTIAIRCASRSHKIELRAQLAVQGSNLTGNWEERSFNASGTVTGQVTDQEISLSIEGGGFTASMLVIQDKQHQSVSIATQGVGFKTVSVSLTRGESGHQDKDN